MKICIFGASGSELDPKYFEDAHSFGNLLADCLYSVLDPRIRKEAE